MWAHDHHHVGMDGRMMLDHRHGWYWFGGGPTRPGGCSVSEQSGGRMMIVGGWIEMGSWWWWNLTYILSFSMMVSMDLPEMAWWEKMFLYLQQADKSLIMSFNWSCFCCMVLFYLLLELEGITSTIHSGLLLKAWWSLDCIPQDSSSLWGLLTKLGGSRNNKQKKYHCLVPPQIIEKCLLYTTNSVDHSSSSGNKKRSKDWRVLRP